MNLVEQLAARVDALEARLEELERARKYDREQALALGRAARRLDWMWKRIQGVMPFAFTWEQGTRLKIPRKPALLSEWVADREAERLNAGAYRYDTLWRHLSRGPGRARKRDTSE